MSSYLPLSQNADAARSSDDDGVDTPFAPPAYANEVYPPVASTSAGVQWENFIHQRKAKKQDLVGKYNVNTDLPPFMGRFTDTLERHEAHNALFAVDAGQYDIGITLRGDKRATLKVEALKSGRSSVIQLQLAPGAVTVFDLDVSITARNLCVIVPDSFGGAISGRCELAEGLRVRATQTTTDEQDTTKNRFFVRPTSTVSLRNKTGPADSSADEATPLSILHAAVEYPHDTLSFITVKSDRICPAVFVGTKEDYEQKLFDEADARNRAEQAGFLALARYRWRNADPVDKQKRVGYVLAMIAIFYLLLCAAGVTAAAISMSED